ncbi:MAG: hypothetical protein K2X01_04235 [Cyanobacteria bacterium]|nr:hypothetical protein [Cyanobacteriota bacterium]
MQIGVKPNVGFGQIRRSNRAKLPTSIGGNNDPSKRTHNAHGGSRGSGLTIQEIGMPLPTKGELDVLQAWVDHEFAQGNIPTWKSLRS